MKKRRGFIIGDTLAWWIIGIFVLVVMLIFFFILKNEGTSLIEVLKNLVRFRG